MEPGGQAGDALRSAAADLAAARARLAEVDAVLIGVLRDAHLVAVESIDRLTACSDEIEAAVRARRTDTPAAGRQFAGFLLAKNREITAIVADARAASTAAAQAVRSLTAAYTG